MTRPNKIQQKVSETNKQEYSCKTIDKEMMSKGWNLLFNTDDHNGIHEKKRSK